jgi:hypothetical protein
MFPGQFETGCIVIKGDIFPAAGAMTGPTVSPELTVVLIILLVTGKTVAGRSLEYPIRVAGGTGYILMSPTQFKTGGIMIEGDISPATGVMACGTVRAELTIMGIIRGMAGIAIGWRAAIAICMAALAVDSHMLACQCKTGELAVIEIHVPPAACIMTLSAIRTKLTHMLVILLVA